MRYIDLSRLLRKRWRWGDRKELWKNKNLKMDFRAISYGKCWYTESSLTGSDIDIDHFRPKAAVSPYGDYRYNTQLRETGYYWLSREPKNYRGSCVIANRPREQGGKWDFFPLVDDSPLMAEGTDVVEKPLLLDPCSQDDVNLIGYDANGIFCASNEQVDQKRVEVSRELYNWDNSDMKRDRMRVWNNVYRIIDKYKKAKMDKETCIEFLKDAVSRESPYSACAISCVRSMAPDEIKQELEADLVL